MVSRLTQGNAMKIKNERAGERGAVSIKTILVLFVLATAAFLILKLAPVYVEQRKIIFDVEELARISAVRGYQEPKITPEITRLRSMYDLPEGSISFVKREGSSVQIAVSYTRSVDLIVTTYDWKVQ